MNLNKVEIDGNAFVEDPNNEGEPLTTDDGEKVPYSERDKVADKFSDEDNDADKSKDDDKDLSNIPFDELKEKHPKVAEKLKEAKKYREQLEDIKKKQKEREEQKKKKKGKYEELLKEKEKELEEIQSENKKRKSLLSKHKETIDRILEDIEEQIPEERRTLIPSNFSNRQKLEYIVENAEHLGAKVAINKGGDVPSNQDNPPLDREGKLQKEFQELMNKDDLSVREDQKLRELSKKLKEIRKSKE